MDKIKDECGVVAISCPKSKDTAMLAFLALNGLQHRGQESAGLAVSNDGVVTSYKDMGLVNEVINEQILSLLKGELCLGHVKYSNKEEKFTRVSGPLVINYRYGSLGIAFNGGLLNGEKLRRGMEDDGVIFTTKSDCEIIAALIARNDKGDIATAIQKTMQQLSGGYAFGLITGDKIIGVRDPFAIRPLALGKIDGGYIIASESCAFDMVDGEFIRDLSPGEIVIIEGEDVTCIQTVPPEKQKRASCIFEYVYFSRPDSTVDGTNVYSSRETAGKLLAKECPAKADLVMGVPDSGTPAAIGFAAGSGIPFSAGLIKNKYFGRTFIQPDQAKREMGVKIKLNPISSLIKGKSIVLVDDSIVRGTTMKGLIATIKNCGATEVHLRISSPPVFNSCHFGVDTPDKRDLIANTMNIEEIRKTLGVDSLGFISIESLLESVGGGKENYCTGCFSGQYPIILEE